MHATPTARELFLANFYPSGPFTFIFFQNVTRVFPVLAVAYTGVCVVPQNKLGHPAHRYRQVILVPVLSFIVFLSLCSELWMRFELWFYKKRLVQ